MMIIPFNLNDRFNDYDAKRELDGLHSSAVTIEFGETLTGSIDYPGEIDNYTFSANSGDTVLIRMGFVSGAYFDPEIELYSPTDISLSSSWGYVLAEITYTLPQNGVYKIEAGDYQSGHIGTYCIYIQRVNNPGNGTSVEFGNNIFGNINLASEAETYTFSANAGDSILIKMGRITGTNFEQEIRLYSPTGNILERDWDTSNAAEIYQALPQSGLYTILACEYSGVDIGSYNLYIQRINNPGNAESFDLGNTTTASIALSGEADTYTFFAYAGEAVLIRMGEVSGTFFDPDVILYSPTGAELARYGHFSKAELSYTLPLDGIYTVLALDQQGLDVGTYSLSIQIVNNPGNAVPITFGTTIFGTINLPSEFDTFTFYANAGDVVLITMMRFSVTNFFQEVRLYSPLGTQLARQWGSSYAAEIHHALPQNGEYTIVACEYNSVNAGSYYLFIQRINNPGNAITFDPGNTVSASLGVPGEADTYSFLGSVGETVVIRISEVSGTNFNPELRLYSPTGTLLAQRTSPLNVELSYTVPLDGIYSVLIRDHEGNGVGVYYINIQNVNNPGNPIPITFGSTIFGVIEFPSEVDTYTFLANSGDSIFITMGRVLGTTFNEEIRLYSPSGIELRHVSGGTVAAEIFYTLPQDGEYTVLACESDSVDTGSYYLFIQRVNNPINTVYMDFGRRGSSIIASIGFPSEADTYTFYGSFGDVVDISMDEVSGTSFGPEIRLYSPTGAELARDVDDDHAQIYHYTLPQDGIFTLLAFDSYGLHIGVYDLFFQFPYREYTPAQDTPFLVTTFIDKVYEFGELELNVRFHKLEAKGDETAFKNALEGWGINFYDFDKIHACWLLELGDFFQVFDWFEAKIPNIFTPELRANLENYISDDGYIRLSFTSMSNFEDIGSEMQKDILGFLLDAFTKENIGISAELFEKFDVIFRFFFDIGIGANQHIIRLELKPEFDVADLLINVILDIASEYNLAVNLLNIQDNSISSTTIFEFKSLVKAADFIYNTIKLAFKGAIVWIQGGANILSDLRLANKIFTYILDYLLHYEAGKNQWLDVIYAIASSWDPPVARLDLQIRDAETNQLLLGYDPTTDNTSYYCEDGFFAGDLESQFALFDTSLFPVNVSIVNTHLIPSHPSIFLNYSLFFGMTNTTSYSNIFNIVESNQQISTTMDYTVSEGLIYHQLSVELMDQGDLWVEINITDNYGDLVLNPQLKAFYYESPINATITELSEGRYRLVLSSTYSEKEIVVVAEKSRYLSNSVLFILGKLNPLEEPKKQEPSISGYIVPILILMVFGTIVVFMKKRKIS